MFHRNERPIYFISATNFNLLGMDQLGQPLPLHQLHRLLRWPASERLRAPGDAARRVQSIEDINNYLLQHKDVIDFIERRGGNPAATFLMFDEKTEELAKELGMEVWFPPAKLRQRCDNKMETVRIGNKAGVLSVPNVLEKVSSYANLMETCRAKTAWATW
jgi:biotin carboxylase